MLFRDRAGGLRDTLLSMAPVEIDGVQCLVSVVNDITERKRIQDEIASLERRYHSIFTLAPELITVTAREDGRFIEVNEVFVALIGYDRSEALGKTSTELGIWPSHDERSECVRIISEQGRMINRETRFRARSGKMLDTLCSMMPIDLDGVPCIISVASDITELKRVEAEMESLTRRFSTIFNLAPELISVTTLDGGRYLEVNDAFVAASGYARENLIGRTSLELGGWIAESDRNSIVGEVLEKGFIRNREIPFRSRDGRIIDTLFSMMPIDLDGTPCLVCVATDISERKAIEESLKKAEEKYRAIFENAVEGIFQTTPEGGVLSVNPAFARMTGYAEPQEMMGSFTDIGAQLYADPTDRDLFKQTLDEHGKVMDFEARLKRRDGSIIWVSLSAAVVCDVATRRIYYQGTMLDITEKRLAEQALRESERLLADIIDFLPDATFAIDCKGRVIAWNRAIEEMTGVPKERMLGLGDHEYSLPFYHERRPILIDLVLARNADIEKEYHIIDVSGRKIVAETPNMKLYGGRGAFLWGIAGPLYDSAGNIVGAIESIRDITDRRNAEMAARESEALMRTLLNTIPFDVWAIDAGQRYILQNAASIRLWGNMAGFGPPDSGMPPDVISRWRSNNMRVLAGESIDAEVEMRLNDGMRVFREVLAPIREGDVIAGAVGVNIDITEKRKSEEALRASLAEKEVLLREVHHRVKNNFQVIISLLNLQSRSVSGEDIRGNLLDAQNRIRAMALIHEKVYRSVNLAEIDFGEYLKSLAGDLRRLYVPATGRIELTVEAENLILPVDKAIPCGLVVNELLTNALKYAFPGEQSGAVRVQAGMSGSDAVRVVVSDNGIGLPAGMEPEKSDTLGLKLVQILVSGQMKGSVKFVQDSGTAVEVVFPRITVE